jgi:hypothetical protein
MISSVFDPVEGVMVGESEAAEVVVEIVSAGEVGTVGGVGKRDLDEEGVVVVVARETVSFKGGTLVGFYVERGGVTGKSGARVVVCRKGCRPGLRWFVVAVGWRLGGAACGTGEKQNGQDNERLKPSHIPRGILGDRETYLSL